MSNQGNRVPTERPSAPPSRNRCEDSLTNAQHEFARVLGHLLARLWQEKGSHVKPRERDESEGEHVPMNPAGD
jgi:hypothetical protein